MEMNEVGEKKKKEKSSIENNINNEIKEENEIKEKEEKNEDFFEILYRIQDYVYKQYGKETMQPININEIEKLKVDDKVCNIITNSINDKLKTHKDIKYVWINSLTNEIMNEIKENCPDIVMASKKKIIIQEREVIDRRNKEDPLRNSELLNDEININIEKKPEIIKDSDVDRELKEIITTEAELSRQNPSDVSKKIDNAIQFEIKKRLHDVVIKATSQMIEKKLKDTYIDDRLISLVQSYQTIKKDISAVEDQLYEKQTKKRDFMKWAGILERSIHNFINGNIKTLTPQQILNNFHPDLKESITNYIKRKIEHICQCIVGGSPIDDSDPETTKYIAEQMKSYRAYHKKNGKQFEELDVIDNIRDSINLGIAKIIQKWRDEHENEESERRISWLLYFIRKDMNINIYEHDIDEHDEAFRNTLSVKELKQLAAICMSNITATIGEPYLKELQNDKRYRESLEYALKILKEQLKDTEDKIKFLQEILKQKQSSVEGKKEKNDNNIILNSFDKELSIINDNNISNSVDKELSIIINLIGDKKEEKKEDEKEEKKEDKKEENNINIAEKKIKTFFKKKAKDYAKFFKKKLKEEEKKENKNEEKKEDEKEEKKEDKKEEKEDKKEKKKKKNKKEENNINENKEKKKDISMSLNNSHKGKEKG